MPTKLYIAVLDDFPDFMTPRCDSEVDHEACREREFELREQITYLKGQITYLQEELALTEDRLNDANRRLAEYDEGIAQ